MDGIKTGCKVCCVIGACGFLGQAIISHLLSRGMKVILGDIVQNSLETYGNELSKTYSMDEFFCCRVDITSADSLDALIRVSQSRFGRVDALINTAYPRNASYGKPFEEIEFIDFCENVNLHLGGYFLTTQRFAIFFKKQGHGNVINISSVYGHVAPKFDIYADNSCSMPIEYSAIKAGLNHLTRYLAKYYRGSDMRFNVVSPGGLANNQPAEFVEKYNAYCIDKGLLDPVDVCGTIEFLLSDDSRYINGQCIILDDGFTL